MVAPAMTVSVLHNSRLTLRFRALGVWFWGGIDYGQRYSGFLRMTVFWGLGLMVPSAMALTER